MGGLWSLERWTAAARRKWSTHPITTVTVVATFGLLFGLQQTSRILADIPIGMLFAARPDVHTLIAAGLILYLATLLGLYGAFVAALLSEPPESRESPLEAAAGSRRLLHGWQVVRGLPDRLARRLGERWRSVLSWIFLAVSVAALVLYALPGRSFGLAPFYSFAVLAGAGAWWLGRGRFEEPEDDRERRWSYAMGVGLFALTASLTISELLWWLIGSRVTLLSWQVYGYWAFLHVCCFALAVAATIDAYGTSRVSRNLLATVAFVVMVFVASRPVPVGRVAVEEETEGGTAARSNAVPLEWFRAVHGRLNQMPPDDPVLLVAASGGGSRAALYATLVLEALERTPAEGDPTRDWADRVEGENASLADRVLLVSSVSGGSLASAHFAASPDANPPLRRPRNTLPESLENDFTREWCQMCAEAGSPPAVCTGDAAAPAVTDESGRSGLSATLRDRVIERFCQAGKGGFEYANAEADERHEIPPWPIGSVRFDQLASDFNAPLLRGAIHPGVGRGQSVSRFWEDRFDWNEEVPGTRAPLLLLNMTNVERGSRLVSGFPRLPPRLLGAIDPDGDATRHLTLSELDPPVWVSLQTATRMSANFPLGFALPELESHGDAVLATDGGVLDNTGIDTLNLLFERLDSHATDSGLGRAASSLSKALGIAYGGEGVRAFCELAARQPDAWRKAVDESEEVEYADLLSLESRCLMDRLSARGAVLLEIDSGAKPESPGWLANVFASTTLPFTALSRSAYVRSIKSVATYADNIQRYLRVGAERQMPAVWKHVRECAARAVESRNPSETDCTDATESTGPSTRSGEEFSLTSSRLEHVSYSLDTEHLMTAWSMSSRQKADLLARFIAEDTDVRIELRRSFDNLRGANQLRCGLISWAAHTDVTSDVNEADAMSYMFRSFSYAQMDLERHHRVEDEWRRAERAGAQDFFEDRDPPRAFLSLPKFLYLGYHFDPEQKGAPRVVVAPKDRVGLWCPNYLPPLSGEPDDSLPAAGWLIRRIGVEPDDPPSTIRNKEVETTAPGYLLTIPMSFFLTSEQILDQGSLIRIQSASPFMETGLYFGLAAMSVDGS